MFDPTHLYSNSGMIEFLLKPARCLAGPFLDMRVRLGQLTCRKNIVQLVPKILADQKDILHRLFLQHLKIGSTDTYDLDKPVIRPQEMDKIAQPVAQLLKIKTLDQ